MIKIKVNGVEILVENVPLLRDFILYFEDQFSGDYQKKYPHLPLVERRRLLNLNAERQYYVLIWQINEALRRHNDNQV